MSNVMIIAIPLLAEHCSKCNIHWSLAGVLLTVMVVMLVVLIVLQTLDAQFVHP